MKKIILLFAFVLITTQAFATTVVYRVSSGEVEGISVENRDFSVDYKSPYYAIATDPTFVDGTEHRDSKGELRVLGISKIFDSGTVRNATQAEIDTFIPAINDDREVIATEKAKEYFLDHPQMRKILTAFAAIMVDEINILRQQHGLSDRTLPQLKTLIINRISKDD